MSDIVRYRDGGLTRVVSLVRMVELFERFGLEGLSVREISDKLGGSGSSLMRRYPALKGAYQRGIDCRTIDVESSLLKRALGYRESVRKVVHRSNNEGCSEEVVTEEEVIFPPDVAAMRLFLKGRESIRYRGDDDGKVGVTININGADAKL